MKRTLLLLVSLTLCSIFLSCNSESEKIIFHASHEESRLGAPFSDVVEFGDLLFLTGQIGKDHQTGKLVPGGIKVETTKVIENIEDVLEFHGSTLDQVVKCTVILKEIEHFKAFNTVYMQYFPKKPARTTFAASALAGGALIEIDVIAVK
ncbi:MAG: RidA family protein [Winogradskyella sp.]|nr:RidA family protein [Winogradskyella sp.]NNL82899.1 RidA family protein [Winogradskyella sp.]